MSTHLSAAPRAPFRLFGVPVGNFGLFGSVLISFVLGFMAFFAVTFLSIFGLLFYNLATHGHIGLDVSYKFIALPSGLLVLAASLLTLLAVWWRNRVAGARS